MIFADAINYAHDLVVKCGKLDLHHKMEAHNAIDMIEAAYKSELGAHCRNFECTINNLVAENDRLKSANARMREALSLILSKATETSNEDAVGALNWIDETASHAISLAAGGDVK